MVTTIQIDESLKEKLDQIKVHPRETYNELIFRLSSSIPKSKLDKESLMETIEILSDPEMMRDISDALKSYDRGEFVEL